MGGDPSCDTRMQICISGRETADTARGGARSAVPLRVLMSFPLKKMLLGLKCNL